MKLKKIVYPFIVPLLLSIIYIVVDSYTGKNLGWGVILFAYLLIAVTIILPLCCYKYGKMVLLNCKNSLFLCVFNSIVITLFYIFPLYTEAETYLYAMILFFWYMFWSVLPFLINYVKYKKSR